MNHMMTIVQSPLARRLISWIAVASCYLPVAIPAAATAADAPTASLTSAPGSRLWLEGESTLHAYSSNATQFEATAEFDGMVPAGAAEARAAIAGGMMKSLRVSVPVASLKSGESGLDKNLQKALKQDAVPVIRFTLVDYKSEEAKDGSLLVKAHGRLAIAGIEKDATVEGTCRFGPGGVEVSGAKEVLMSDFGIKPPVLMFGAIKTADKVVVHFVLKLKPSDAMSTSNH
jgi:polyisoprenoid-binding protein YceI